LTRFDNAEEYFQTIREVTAEVSPRGRIDEFLIQRMALNIARARRAQRMEADMITSLSNRSVSAEDESRLEAPLIDPLVMKEYVGPGLDVLLRYDSAIVNQLLRLKREFEDRADECDTTTQEDEEGGNLIN
jgi:hypothetical protein